MRVPLSQLKPGARFRIYSGDTYVKTDLPPVEDDDGRILCACLGDGLTVDFHPEDDMEVVHEIEDIDARIGDKWLSDVPNGRKFRFAGDPWMLMSRDGGHKFKVVNLRTGQVKEMVDGFHRMLGGRVVNLIRDDIDDTNSSAVLTTTELKKDADRLYELAKGAAAHLYSRDMITAEEYEELTS